MAIEKSLFGKSRDGQAVYLYTMRNGKGMTAAVTDLGAILVNLIVPDKNGNPIDVVLGFDKAEDYYGNPSFFGSTIGPSANRIAGAAFELDGVTCKLSVNDNENNLHSDIDYGYHKLMWNTTLGDNSVTFSLEEADGNMGFPGKRTVQVTYTLDEENGLSITYHGSCDKKTILNPTNHSYFNLEGHDSGIMEQQELWMKASHYTPVVAGAIPTGEIVPVQGTPMDFTTAEKIGARIEEDFEQLTLTAGYDHNWVIDGWDGSLQHFATMKAPKSGIVMKAYTTLPGVQFYAGNFIETQTGKGGVTYARRHAICLETQYYPDTIHNENFPSCVFGGEAGDYNSTTVYRFE